MGYVYLLLALTLNATANILIKVGSGKFSYFEEYGLIVGLFKNYVLLIGLACFAVNVAFYSLALTKLNLSIAYPIMTVGGIAIITLVSVLSLKETLTLQQGLGIVLMMLGIVLLLAKNGAPA